MTKYIPKKGDIVWIDFNTQAGTEILKRRPALVVSSSDYNKGSQFVIVCPITSTRKGYPFEIAITVKGKDGAILVDQIKSFDCVARDINFIEKCSEKTLVQTKKIIALILDLHKII